MTKKFCYPLLAILMAATSFSLVSCDDDDDDDSGSSAVVASNVIVYGNLFKCVAFSANVSSESSTEAVCTIEMECIYQNEEDDVYITFRFPKSYLNSGGDITDVASNLELTMPFRDTTYKCASNDKIDVKSGTLKITSVTPASVIVVFDSFVPTFSDGTAINLNGSVLCSIE